MNMAETFEQLAENISLSVPESDGEYRGEDGLLRCKICHGKTQTKVSFLGREKIVRCICSCKQKEMNAHKEQERLEEIERRRRICFGQTNMANWTFKNDDMARPQLSNAMKRYADQFREFKREGKGLLLWGSVGTGKTYLAACIANELIDNDYLVKMAKLSELANQIQGMFEGKQEFIESLNKYTLLILDDLGAERSTEYMKEIIFNIIDSRYRSGLPFIVTTNLTMNEMKQPSDIGYARIYDRVLERCHPIQVDGVSRRRQNVKESYFDMKEKLGL